jgi:hypothetical protein
VVRLSALATLLPEKNLELEAGWVLELVWMFWRRDSAVASVKILTPVYIVVIVFNMLSHTGLKKMSILY